MESKTKLKKIFKWISFGLLILVVTTTILSMGWQVITDNLVQAEVITSESLAQDGIDSITGKIYYINGILCGLSILSGCSYLFLSFLMQDSNDTYSSYKKKSKNVKEKFDFKNWFKRFWPCILLVIFMLWTAVGCIQASTEAAAEAFVNNYEEAKIELQKEILTGSAKEAANAKKELEELNKKYEKNKEIAEWSSTDRMPNAADRGWNGCSNLKDGYWSFTFYAMVVINVILLGANSNNLKKWILRVLLASGLLLVFISFCSLLNPVFFGGSVKANRAIFNNSNHYGYYLCIISMLCATIFVKDKSISAKIIALVGFALTSFMLIVNNTFGSYLGVMVAIGIMFICTSFGMAISIIKMLFQKKIEEKDCNSLKKQFIENVKDFAKVATIALIFGFFSYTITGAESKVYLEDKYVCQKSYIGTTFGERSLLSKNKGYTATLLNASFDLSGDNRVYTVIEKSLEKLDKNEKVNEDDEIYYLNGHNYKTVKTETKNIIRTPEEYSNNTIVKRNFEQLFKDLKIILASNDVTDKENVNTENNKSGEALSGEIISGEKISGEALLVEGISGEFKENNSESEKINEKSGLSEEVSNTGSGRGEVWIKSLDLMEQRPLFGWGLENMLNEFYKQYGINEGRTHNLILQLAGTTGIVGMLLYISAVAVIFFKVLFDFKFIDYKIKTRSILLAICAIVGIIIYAIMQKAIGVMLLSAIVAFAVSVFLALISNIKSMKLRISKWGLIEYVTMPTFIAYMVSSLFGNSAFYTSPYFMVILGMMIASIIYNSHDIEENSSEKLKKSK